MTNQCATATTGRLSMRLWPRNSRISVLARCPGWSKRSGADGPSRMTLTMRMTASVSTTSAMAVTPSDTTTAAYCMAPSLLSLHGWNELFSNLGHHPTRR